MRGFTTKGSGTRRFGSWALWADALPMIQERNPAIAEIVENAMVHNVFPPEWSLSELVQATSQLDQEGFAERPSWSELRRGKRPPPGEWQHGWQYWAYSASDRTFRKSTMLSGQSASNRAHLRSHSGRNAGVVFAHVPTAPEFVVPPHLFRVLLLERMRLALPITEATCGGCCAPLDPHGLHRAACTRSGRLKKRATSVER